MLQLVGVTAMFIASKYEEMYPPEIGDFAFVTDNTYTKHQIRQMEMKILRSLNFGLGRPLPLHFLRRASKIGEVRSLWSPLVWYMMKYCYSQADLIQLTYKSTWGRHKDVLLFPIRLYINIFIKASHRQLHLSVNRQTFVIIVTGILLIADTEFSDRRWETCGFCFRLMWSNILWPNTWWNWLCWTMIWCTFLLLRLQQELFA